MFQKVRPHQLAKEIEVSPSILSRLANDLKPDVNAFAAMVTWLNVPAETFIQVPGEQAERTSRRCSLSWLRFCGPAKLFVKTTSTIWKNSSPRL